jgi:formylglycine-generating enzyme required for sulfatase activity
MKQTIRFFGNIGIIFLAALMGLFIACGGDDSGTKIKMVLIPSGNFMMGSPESEAGHRDSEAPRHSVTLTRDFYMGIYPVTKGEYAAVMRRNANGASTNPICNFGSSLEKGEVRQPVVGVRWYDAILFCNRLSMQQGLTPVYSISDSTNPADWGNVPTGNNSTWNSVRANWDANGYRLPTEAEWEYACRAGTTTAWYTGNTEDAALLAAAWYGDVFDSSSYFRQDPHDVGLKTPNAWGLYDMHGNVWERCWDRFSSSIYNSEGRTDPRGASSLFTSRVGRGGSRFSSGAEIIRSARRNSNAPSDRFSDVGFRVVRNAQ